jgi:hypothetical protein
MIFVRTEVKRDEILSLFVVLLNTLKWVSECHKTENIHVMLFSFHFSQFIITITFAVFSESLARNVKLYKAKREISLHYLYHI